MDSITYRAIWAACETADILSPFLSYKNFDKMNTMAFTAACNKAVQSFSTELVSKLLTYLCAKQRKDIALCNILDTIATSISLPATKYAMTAVVFTTAEALDDKEISNMISTTTSLPKLYDWFSISSLQGGAGFIGSCSDFSIAHKIMDNPAMRWALRPDGGNMWLVDVCNFRCEKGTPMSSNMLRLFDRVLNDPRTDPTLPTQHESLLCTASRAHNYAILNILLDCPRLDGVVNEYARLLLQATDDPIVLQMLLSDPRIHPERVVVGALSQQSRMPGDMRRKLLAANVHIDPSAGDNQCIVAAVMHNMPDLLQDFLLDLRIKGLAGTVNLCIGNQHASLLEIYARYTNTCGNRRDKLFDFILRDPRTDIAAGNWNIFRHDLECGEVLTLLRHAEFEGRHEEAMTAFINNSNFMQTHLFSRKSYISNADADSETIEVLQNLFTWRPSLSETVANMLLDNTHRTVSQPLVFQVFILAMKFISQEHSLIKYRMLTYACNKQDLAMIKYLVDTMDVDPSANGNAALLVSVGTMYSKRSQKSPVTDYLMHDVRVVMQDTNFFEATCLATSSRKHKKNLTRRFEVARKAKLVKLAASRTGEFRDELIATVGIRYEDRF